MKAIKDFVVLVAAGTVAGVITVKLINKGYLK